MPWACLASQSMSKVNEQMELCRLVLVFPVFFYYFELSIEIKGHPL